MFSANDPGAVVAQLIFSLVDAFALTILVFFRKNFGERFLTVFKFGMAVGILAFLMGLRSLVAVLIGALPLFMGMFGISPFLGMLAAPMLSHRHAEPQALFDAAKLLYYAFIFVGGGHLVAMWLRSWRIGDKVPVLSRSTGEPLLTFNGRLNYWLVVLALEPLCVLLLGQILNACDPRLPYAYFVVLALFIQASAFHQYRLYKSDLLDQQDARLMAGFYTEQAKRVAAGGKPAWKLGGLFMPLMLPRKPAMQVDVLRQWASQYRAEAEPVALPSSSEEASPPPPPQQAA
jgi:hypothetical protein